MDRIFVKDTAKRNNAKRDFHGMTKTKRLSSSLAIENKVLANITNPSRNIGQLCELLAKICRLVPSFLWKLIVKLRLGSVGLPLNSNLQVFGS